jgi:cytochrome P450
MLGFLANMRERSSVELQFASAAALALVAVYTARRLTSGGNGKKQLSVAAPATRKPIIGDTWELLQNNDNFHDWLLELALQFDGRPFSFKAPGRPPVLVITSPEELEDVAKTQYDNFGKGPYLYDLMYDLVGDSLAVVDGEPWRFQRKIFASLFSARTLRESMTAVVQKHTQSLNKTFERAASTGEALDLFKLMNRFTMVTFAEIGCGIQMDSLVTNEEHPFENAFEDAEHIIGSRMSLPVWFWKLQRLLNVGSEKHLKECVSVIDKIIYNFIAESMAARARYAAGDKKGDKPGGRDIISIVLDNAEMNEGVTPTLLRDVVVSALVAGRDTTAETLSWFFHTLASHPDVERQIREEIRAVIPALFEDPDYIPSMEEVQELTFMEACFRETLRLFPPAAFNFKHSYNDTFLSDGTFVPAGTDIGIPYYAMGRMPKIWGPDCGEFKPARFLDAATGKLRQFSPFKFNAFHAGPRMCIGRNLAMLEMKLVVSRLLSRFHVVETPGQTITYCRSITLPMKYPMMVTVESLAGVAAA